MRKFTLIELLIVIVIIAILLSLLLPSLRQAKDKAKTIVCGNQEKQLYLGFTLYTNDNKTFLPYGENPSGWLVSSWEWRIAPYTGIQLTDAQMSSNSWILPKENPLLHCPADPYKKATSGVGFARSYVINSVEYWTTKSTNFGVIGSEWSRSLASINQNTLLLTEDHRNHDYKVQGSSWASAMGSWAWPGVIISKHPKENFNYLYIDGHVENLEIDEMQNGGYDLLKAIN